MNVVVVLVGAAGVVLVLAVIHADYRRRQDDGMGPAQTEARYLDTYAWCNHDRAAVVDGVCECGEVIDGG